MAWIQRTAGNQAVTAFLQRQTWVGTKTSLIIERADQAVLFYQGRPDLYPSDVVRKIQQTVHSPETGTADNAMAEGVAKFQRESALKVDGMAGPRTLTRLFESGLALEANRKSFVTTGKAVEVEWTTLATPDARADKLFEGGKALLDGEKVTTPSHRVERLRREAGLFESKDWRITFDPAALSQASIDDDAAQNIASTVYHEARHAEQHHKMARMLATKGLNAVQISARMTIPIEVAEDAFKNKLPRGIEFTTAAQQFDSVYGSGRAHFEKAEAVAPTMAELRAAVAAAAADPSPANQAKLARMKAAFAAYHDLPTEHDAFSTSNAFEASWDEATVGP